VRAAIVGHFRTDRRKIMVTQLPHRETHPLPQRETHPLPHRETHLRTAARPVRVRTARTARAYLGRVAAAIGAATCAVLAFADAVPAAFAATPVPPPGGQYGPAPSTPGTITRVITVGGMPGWQIALIAVAAALAAAAVAVIVDRMLARHRLVSAMTA
jgi:hypothetical protein